VTQGVIQRFSASGRSGESFTNRELFQHYGFTSRPLSGSEVIILNEGNHIVAIATDDRRYRIFLEAGEVALYTDEGDYIHFRRNREIHVKGGEKVRIETPRLEIIGPDDDPCDVSIKANISVEGNIHVEGGVDATGSIIDGGGNTNHHTH
jgi:phage baseplate assembly protein V